MFETFELSRQDGAPIELYEFAIGDCVFWRYTSSRKQVTFQGETWEPEPIKRSRIQAATDQARNGLSITVPRNNEVADQFREAPPENIITLKIYGLHRNDSDSIVLWMGRVLNAKWTETSTAELRCEPISFSMGRFGLRRLYQLNCPHVLYGPQCGLNKADFAHITTVTDVSGATLTVDTQVTTTYPGGFIEWAFGNPLPIDEKEGELPCDVDRRFITGHDEDTKTFTLQRPFSGIEVGHEIALYPGCAHNMDACLTVFDNLLNYGGMPYMPINNPFSGSPIF